MHPRQRKLNLAPPILLSVPLPLPPPTLRCPAPAPPTSCPASALPCPDPTPDPCPTLPTHAARVPRPLPPVPGSESEQRVNRKCCNKEQVPQVPAGTRAISSGHLDVLMVRRV